jgi:hypothetical protein
VKLLSKKTGANENPFERLSSVVFHEKFSTSFTQREIALRARTRRLSYSVISETRLRTQQKLV